MSDYLWDGTGEPEAEVERLEALLSSFGHAPRPLALPPQEAADVSPRVRRAGAWRRLFPARLFAPVRLAAAAALLLAFVFGAGALLRVRLAVDEERAASSEVRRAGPEAPPTQAPKPGRRESPSAPVEVAGVGGGPESADVPAGGNVGAPVVVDAPRKRAGAQPAAFVKPRRKPAANTPGAAVRAGEAGTPEAATAGGRGGAASLFDGARLMAKEQLIYALRLTGAKLKEVQDKAQGAGDQKPATRGGAR